MSGSAHAVRSASRLAERLTAIRRELHRYPELSHEEFETTARIRGWLEEAGIRIAERHALRTGVIAVGQRRNEPTKRREVKSLSQQAEIQHFWTRTDNWQKRSPACPGTNCAGKRRPANGA